MIMRQYLLWIKDPTTNEIVRVINSELMSHASVDPENPTGTVIHCAGVRIQIGMSFSEFSKLLEKLIEDNYRSQTQIDAQWHKKRMDDTEAIMKEVMRSHNQ